MAKVNITKTIQQKPPEENLASFLYDLGKIVFATLFIGSLVEKEKFTSPLIWSGLMFTILLGGVALYVDRRK